MKCPRCNADIKYRERTLRTCAKCHKFFAFEPKEHPLRLTDARLVKVVAKLSDGGTLRVLDDHVRHFLARKIAVDDTPMLGWVALIVAIVVALSASPALAEAHQLELAVVLPAAFMLLAVWLAFIRGAVPYARDKLQSALAFRTSLQPYVDIYGHLPPGLVRADEAARLPARTLPEGPMHAVVVCPSPTVIEALRINDIATRHGVGLLCTTGPQPADSRAIVEQLRARPGLPILLFHDASPAGCLLADDLPGQLGLRPDHRIVDMGLFPRRSIAKKRLCLGVPADPALLARLRTRAAPPTTRALRPKRAALTAVEFKWLASGHTTPIESLMPHDLIQRITAAVTRLAPTTKTAVRNFGFMSPPPRPSA